MNTKTTNAVENQDPLESWSRFLNNYCEREGISLEAVSQNEDLIERLNIIWLRVRSAQVAGLADPHGQNLIPWKRC